MLVQGFFQIGVTLLLMIPTVFVLGPYMARIFMKEKTFLDPIASPIEQLIYRICGIHPEQNMTGWGYGRAVLFSNLWMALSVFILQMIQEGLPLNPTRLAAPSWHLAIHTAVSFVTNTNQQHYSGEVTYSYLTQIAALGFMMFTSAATGIAVAIAFIRGLTGRQLGNFYEDFTLAITRLLLPLSILGGMALLLLGVPETLAGPAIVTTLEGSTQAIARGPVAHFEIIKQLGENGGGFFAINSAHPLENPNTFTNLIETLAMLAIPTSFILTYGYFANNLKQAWLLFGMVFGIFVVLVYATAAGEFWGNPEVNGLLGSPWPNGEGKEVRFGWAQTAFWAVSTTATMCGAINGLHDSLMPPGGFSTLLNMFLQIIWGGQGTGTAYLFIFVILTVFLTGLMVGRTPEFLGRKIEKQEIVLASVILLVHPLAILIPSAITLALPDLSGISNPGSHGLAQVVYEYASAAANNGSGFEGLGDGSLWWNLSTAVVMTMGRYLPIMALLLLADSMSRKQLLPQTAGTLRTDTGLFTGITAGTIVILGLLTFLPVLALGPIAEGFQLAAGL
ncbi:MAG: potassium-transporting ATPase subunit KdpA [Cyanobacteriota bacterium]|nr:potassium-transporting ATPase subunit KdpA [Cyanobacteriota bacterium]